MRSITPNPEAPLPISPPDVGVTGNPGQREDRLNTQPGPTRQASWFVVALIVAAVAVAAWAFLKSRSPQAPGDFREPVVAPGVVKPQDAP